MLLGSAIAAAHQRNLKNKKHRAAKSRVKNPGKGKRQPRTNKAQDRTMYIPELEALKMPENAPQSILTIKQKSRVAKLAKAKENLAEAVGGGLVEDTRRQYDGYVRRFIKFAEDIGVPAGEALPSDPLIVSLFLADGIGETGPGNAQKKLTSIKSWHKDNNVTFTPPGNLDRIYKGIARKWPKNEQPEELRPPITSDMMAGIIDAWTGGTAVQVAALAIAITAWCGLCRLGELIPAREAGAKMERHPLRVHWTRRRRNEDGQATSSTLYLPWTKTTWAKGALIELVQQKGKYNPSTAIEEHLRKSRISDKEALLCEYNESGSRKILDKETLLEMCNEVWEPLGLGRFTGHCFRIGGTTAFILAGVDLEIVKKMGRWSSESFKLYWRHLHGIIGHYAANVDWNDRLVL